MDQNPVATFHVVHAIHARRGGPALMALGGADVGPGGDTRDVPLVVLPRFLKGVADRDELVSENANRAIRGC